MSDTSEISWVRRLLTRPLYSGRIRYTPMRDLLRGRIGERLNWRARLDRAALSAPIADAIRRIVRRTRLWRIEKAEVADELIAHFSDGLTTGASVDDLLRDFGDERAAAKLIRRAKRRGRPLTWHAMKWTGRAFILLVILYAITFVRFLLSRPTVSVDYVAKLNAPILSTPVQDRAWPLYRQAMIAMELDGRYTRVGIKSETDARAGHPLDRFLDPDADHNTVGARQLIDATPSDAAWPQLEGWLTKHAEGIALLRAAADKPAMGFVVGKGGSQHDPELGWTSGGSDEYRGLASQTLLGVLLPHLNHMRAMAMILAADVRYARHHRDGARVVADLRAMIAMGRHNDLPLVVTRLVGIGIYRAAFDSLEETLANDPDLLSDRQLIEVAHDLSTIGGDTASSLIDLTAERMMFHDVVQRAYTDDGNGDGILTPEGARLLADVTAMTTLRGSAPPPSSETMLMAIGSAASLVSSRRDALAELDGALDLQERHYARPLREAGDNDDVDRLLDLRMREIRGNPVLLARHYLFSMMFPALTRAAWTAGTALGQREGLLVGIALELHRRRHGEYPATLEVLTPTLLPRVPADRITGAPVRYALTKGRPVIYSLGVDRDDDGGRAVVHPRDKRPSASFAAEWGKPDDSPRYDGDWILYDGRSQKVGH